MSAVCAATCSTSAASRWHSGAQRPRLRAGPFVASQSPHSLRSGRPCLPSQLYASPPKYNPQNVDDPVIRPSADLSPADSVRVQLEACANNDEPWMNHGIQTMYEFAEDAGGMERSYYFVHFQKDLYHFDHFMGGFSTQLGPLLYNTGHAIVDERMDQPEPGYVQVDARVKSQTQEDAGVYTFTLVQRALGKKKGCWMTKSLAKKAT